MEEKEITDVGGRIKQIRKKAGVTQVEFSRVVGIKPSALTIYERNKRRVPDYVMRSICLSYGISDNWLRTGSGKMIDSIAERTGDRRRDLISYWCNTVIQGNMDTIQFRLLEQLCKLDNTNWKNLESFVELLHITKTSE